MQFNQIITWLMSAMLAIIYLFSNPFPAAAETVSGLCRDDSFITNPANNNQYCYLETPSSWSDAQVAAQAKGGNLVTVNDQAEQDWLLTTFSSYKKTARGSIWIGLNDQEVEGTFVWVSGEPLTFQAWNSGEPNNSGNEDFVELYFTNGKWNDIPPLSSLTLPAIVEKVIPPAPTIGLCKNDSFITNPGNNNQYCYLETPSSWLEAQVAAQAKGGNLVTINDQAEQDWLLTTFSSYKKTDRGSVWIGLNDEAEEGKFVWVSGEPLTFQAWDTRQPDNRGNEDFVELLIKSKTWNDLPNSISFTLPAIVEKVIPPAPTIGLCKNDSFITNPGNNNQYCYLETPSSWLEAQVAAQAKGGNLVTINDQAEQDWLLKTFSGYRATETPIWIGLNDQEEEGKFVWVSGETASFESWYSGESPLIISTTDPNSADFVSLDFRKGKFNAKWLVWPDKINVILRAIVEKNTAPVNPKFETVVDIDARVNNQNKPVVQSLPKGTYQVHLLNTHEGGKFDAWNSIDVARTCDSNGKNCDNGWETRYYFKSPYKKVVDSSCSKKLFGSCRYESAEKAAANAPKDVTFTLSKDTKVNFYIYDTQNLNNNQGGVSLKIIQK